MDLVKVIININMSQIDSEIGNGKKLLKSKLKVMKKIPLTTKNDVIFWRTTGVGWS
jgi:hypothetical protein